MRVEIPHFSLLMNLQGKWFNSYVNYRNDHQISCEAYIHLHCLFDKATDGNYYIHTYDSAIFGSIKYSESKWLLYISKILEREWINVESECGEG